MSKSNSKFPVPLREYWLSLSDKRNERAKLAREVCEKAGITYETFKLVIGKHRRLGIDTAFKLVEASGDKIDINDLIVKKETLRNQGD